MYRILTTDGKKFYQHTVMGQGGHGCKGTENQLIYLNEIEMDQLIFGTLGKRQ